MLSAGLTAEPFDQMLVNEYLPGQGIAFHRDYEPYGRAVASLSLLAACVMDFRHRATDRRERLLLERRSLLVLSDEARYVWEHGIAGRKKDVWQGVPVQRQRRLSVTFRTLSRGADRAGMASKPVTLMSTTNAAVADLLRRYAAVLTVQGADRFKLKAYRRAAETIEGLEQDVADLVRKGGDLTELPGIGKAISAVVTEIVETGQWSRLEQGLASLAPE
jgi:hypothetical protein